MITKESSVDRAGEISAGAVLTNVENGHCNICGHIFLEISLWRQRRVAHVCDNIYCCQFRQIIYYVAMPPLPPAPKKRKRLEYMTPARQRYLTKVKANYALLRSLGVPSVEARNMTSDVRTDEYLKRVGYARC